MCVAILARGQGKLIPQSEFEEMRLVNGDGMGLMWADGGRLHIVRQLRRLGRFWGRYKALHEAGKDVVIHFRLATHGDTSMRNVHPFHVNSRLALVHNGILDGFSAKDVRSDTKQFVDIILKQLPEGWHKTDTPIWETVSLLTVGSKMIFMDSSGLTRIMHANAGWERDGNWFSTMSWQLGQHCGYHLYRGLMDWGDEKNDWAAAKAAATKVAPYDPWVSKWDGTKWDGQTAADAYIHHPSSEIVCGACRKLLMANEPAYNFQTLWDDREPIVCDLCDEVVNRATLEAEFRRQCEVDLDEEDARTAEYGVGATVTGG